MIKKLDEDAALKLKSLDPEYKKNKNVLGRLYGTIATWASPTRNNRHYSSELWEKLFESDLIKERFANGGIFGELCHPDREEVDMEKIAVVMPEPPKKDKDGNLIGYVDIVDTPCGRIAYQLAKYGYKFGISSRGSGDLVGRDGEEVDPDTYSLTAFDLVEVPGVESARLSFTESLDTKKYNKTLRQKLSEQLNSASEEDKRVMEESLDNLGIDLKENDEIKHISEEEADKILNDVNGKYPETGKYIIDHPELDGVEVDDKVVAIDNSTNDAWTEEFPNEEKAVEWLNGEFEVGEEVDEEFYLHHDKLEQAKDALLDRVDHEELLKALIAKGMNDKTIEDLCRKFGVTDKDLGVNILTKDEVKTKYGVDSLSELENESIDEEAMSYDEAKEFWKEKTGKDLSKEAYEMIMGLQDHDYDWDENEKNYLEKQDDLELLDNVDEKLDLANEDEFNIHSDLVHSLYKAIWSAAAPVIEDAFNSDIEVDRSDIIRAAEEAVHHLANEFGINESCNESISESRCNRIVEKLSDLTTEEVIEDVIDTFCRSLVVYCDDKNGSVSKNIIYNIADALKKDYEKWLKESISESCGDKKVEEEEVGDAKDLKELQEALVKSSELEKDNLSLQEKLSVCNAKEISLEEELNKYKACAASLSESAKKAKSLKEDNVKLTEELNSKEKLLKSNKQVFERLENQKKVYLKKLDKYSSKVTDLENQIVNLNESLDTANKKVDASNQAVKKYKSALKESRDSYIKAKADSYNLSVDEVRSNLNESFKLKEVDSICEELYNQKKNLSKLPFRITEDIKINVKPSENESIKRDKFFDDDNVDSLLKMTNLLK